MDQTPFHAFHAQHGAKFVEFAGYELPLHYGSIIEEHKQTRTAASLFDVSHMGRIKLTGRGARRLAERALTRRVSDMPEKTCRYSMICNEQGGVVDDVIVYRFDDHFLIVCNAVNREKVLAQLKRVTGDLSVGIEDTTKKTAMVAVQGPGVMDVVGNYSKEVPVMKNYHFTTKNLMILKLIISRTGYTGEDGVEIILPANMANMALKLLMKEDDGRVKPAGLGARDSLRIEAGMPLYGHELDEQTDPYAAGLGFAVTLDKDEQERGEPFVGQEALKRIKAEGPTKRLVGLKMQGRRTPRQGQTVHANGSEIGRVTSGCASPTLGVPIAMAYVQPDGPTVGETVEVAFNETRESAEVVPLPFYRRG